MIFNIDILDLRYYEINLIKTEIYKNLYHIHQTLAYNKFIVHAEPLITDSHVIKTDLSNIWRI